VKSPRLCIAFWYCVSCFVSDVALHRWLELDDESVYSSPKGPMVTEHETGKYGGKRVAMLFYAREDWQHLSSSDGDSSDDSNESEECED
jgi:hypothetical protein